MMQLMVEMNKNIIETLIGFCLSELVKDNFVKHEQVSGKWYVGHNINVRLEQLGFAAAASIDDAGNPVVFFNSTFPIKAQIWTVPHEAVHLAQICKGAYEPFQGYSLWNGVRYTNLPFDHAGYKTEQPWEAEAFSMEESLRERMHKAFPGFDAA